MTKKIIQKLSILSLIIFIIIIFFVFINHKTTNQISPTFYNNFLDKSIDNFPDQVISLIKIKNKNKILEEVIVNIKKIDVTKEKNFSVKNCFQDDSFTYNYSKNKPDFKIINGNVYFLAKFTGLYRSNLAIFDPSKFNNKYTGFKGLCYKKYKCGEFKTIRKHFETLLLDNNKILIIGGLGAQKNTCLNNVDIYDSQNVTIKKLGMLIKPRNKTKSIQINSSKVLITGGSNGKYKGINNAELFDLKSGKSLLTNYFDTSNEYINYYLIPLANEKILLYGLIGSIYDLKTNKFYTIKLRSQRISPRICYQNKNELIIDRGIEPGKIFSYTTSEPGKLFSFTSSEKMFVQIIKK